MRVDWLLCSLAFLAFGCAGAPVPPPAPAEVQVTHASQATPTAQPSSQPARQTAGAPSSGDPTASPPAGPMSLAELEAPKPSAPCQGSLSAEGVKALRSTGQNTKICYDRLLRTDPKAQGRMILYATYEVDGSVRSLRIDGPIADEAFRGCVVSMFTAGLRETPPTDGCINVEVPLAFMPKTENEGSSQSAPQNPAH